MSALRPWMRRLLWFAGGYNLVMGANLVVLPQRAFAAFEMSVPELLLFVQLVGLMVAVFGVGYLLVAFRPLDNRGVLWLGLLGKALVAVWGVGYVALGKLPVSYLAVVLVSDVVYLWPFAVIVRRLERIAAGRDDV